MGAQPIFNTDVLCFGFPDTPPAEVPAGSPAPARASWRECIAASWTAATSRAFPSWPGALVFDESYLGKPLVFCGTGGVLPARMRGRGCLREDASCRGTSPS